jgi:hypothetical protein
MKGSKEKNAAQKTDLIVANNRVSEKPAESNSGTKSFTTA